MVAHVAHCLANSIKIWDQDEAMNLNLNDIIMTLRIYLSEKMSQKVIWSCDSSLWATTGLQTKVEQR